MAAAAAVGKTADRVRLAVCVHTHVVSYAAARNRSASSNLFLHLYADPIGAPSPLTGRLIARARVEEGLSRTTNIRTTGGKSRSGAGGRTEKKNRKRVMDCFAFIRFGPV